MESPGSLPCFGFFGMWTCPLLPSSFSPNSPVLSSFPSSGYFRSFIKALLKKCSSRQHLNLSQGREKDKHVFIWEQILSAVELLGRDDLCYFVIDILRDDVL